MAKAIKKKGKDGKKKKPKTYVGKMQDMIKKETDIEEFI